MITAYQQPAPRPSNTEKGAVKSMLEAVNVSSPKCGEVWMCNLTEKTGSIESGYRPVFILSNNQNNTFSTTLNVIPITSRVNKRKLPIHVPLWQYTRYGLRKPSLMLVEQITTITAEHLGARLGAIYDRETLNQIYRAIQVQFPIVAMFAS